MASLNCALLPLDALIDLPRQILGTSKLSHKFQITMPKEVRDRFRLEAGEIIVFIEEDGKLVLGKSGEV